MATYTFSLPAYFVLEVEADNETEARRKLVQVKRALRGGVLPYHPREGNMGAYLESSKGAELVEVVE